MRRVALAGLILIALGTLSCKGAKRPEATAGAGNGKGAGEMALTISSAAFNDGAPIPKKFTCSGEDVSPPLSWSGVSDSARSLALIMDDPDAPMGTWVHWVLWGMPPSTPSLPEGVPKDSTLPGGMKQGQNSWPRAGYGGPCPPSGKPHRYFFKLYALDTELNLPTSTTKADLERAMKDHIIAQAQVMGTFGR